jgi:hypothetical protein
MFTGNGAEEAPSKFAEVIVEMHLTAEKISTYQSEEWDRRGGWQLAEHLWREHERRKKNGEVVTTTRKGKAVVMDITRANNLAKVSMSSHLRANHWDRTVQNSQGPKLLINVEMIEPGIRAQRLRTNYTPFNRL